VGGPPVFGPTPDDNKPFNKAVTKCLVPSPISEGPPPLGGVSIEPGNVVIKQNYIRWDADILTLLNELSGTEFKVYIFFVGKSYGYWKQPKNMCSCTNPIISKSTGITGNSTLSKTIESLISKHLLQRILTSHIPGQPSLYRVFLPCERPGVKSRTIIENV
jgi:hypothetical protein